MQNGKGEKKMKFKMIHENYNVAGENENKEIIEALSIKLLENRGANYEK